METMAVKDLYLWHFYIGLPGTMNDLNVMAFSPFLIQWLLVLSLPPSRTQ